MSGPHPVVVVGAGLAGLAAAVELSRLGIPVCVLEQKRHGGGRAYSFTDGATGETIDNGQHVLIAGYTATMRYLELIGARDHLRFPSATPSLTFHHPERGLRRFTLARLPPPFHLLGGVLSTDLFSVADRLRLVRAGGALMRSGESEAELSGLTVDEWLHRAGQSAETIRSFWQPLAIAIMNERTDVASALLFARCLRRAFLGGRKDAALVLPSVGLSELFVAPACRYLGERGSKVVFGARAATVVLENGRAAGVRLQDGSLVDAGAVIVAVPA
ncbi:MAG TPA: FAD-dependent oxidoreductase, partial [Bacteroidota bacterium]